MDEIINSNFPVAKEMPKPKHDEIGTFRSEKPLQTDDMVD